MSENVEPRKPGTQRFETFETSPDGLKHGISVTDMGVAMVDLLT